MPDVQTAVRHAHGHAHSHAHSHSHSHSHGLVVVVVAAAAVLALAAVGCGGGAGGVVKPKDYTAQDALGVGGGAPVKCGGPEPKAAEPLIVDLAPEMRGEVEVHLRKGVVVVAYDCNAVRVLSDCHAKAGAYEYAGWQMKQSVVSMKGLDELKANIPLGAAKFGTELKAGRTIELALLNVGSQSTTMRKVDRAELTGDCEGATHFVKRATVGAFTLATTSGGSASAAADLFGKASASAKSEQDKTASTTDGSLDACRSADPLAEKPTLNCSVPYLLQLVPLVGKPLHADEAPAPAPAPPASDAPDAKKEKDAKEKDKSVTFTAEENTCPADFVFSDGACRKNGASATHLCASKDLEDCKAQCEKNDVGSCFNLGVLLDTQADRAAKPAFEKACAAGHVDACGGVARYTYPKNFSKSTMARAKTALDLSEAACLLGSVIGCADASNFLHGTMFGNDEMRSPADGVKYAERACRLGEASECNVAASDLVSPEPKVGGPKDVPRGVHYFELGCNAGDADQCEYLSKVLLTGKYGATKDIDKGAFIARLACDRDLGACTWATDDLLAAGKEKEAFTNMKRACDFQTSIDKANHCKRLSEFYSAGTGTAKDPSTASTVLATAKEAAKQACADDFKQYCGEWPRPAEKPSASKTNRKKPSGGGGKPSGKNLR